MGEQAWDTGKMRECRNEWSLAADTQLLTYMQQFSQKLLSETHTTLKALDSLESAVATTCVEVSNIGSRFWALSDTQFVENRVYDDDDVISPTSPVPAQSIPKEDTENLVIQRLNEAINNGIQVLDTKFEVVQVVSSDSDDDEDSSPHSGVVLKPVNRYKDRPLPHLIGSAEFHSDHTLGLRDLPSDEETDEFMSASDKAYDESEDSDIESDQTKVQDILAHKQNTNYRPLGLGLPRVQSQSTVSASNSSLPSGGEAEDDQKRMFSRWQPSDLWAPEDDIPKVVGDNSSNYRPPSADSSVSSAPSSIMSEPVKKTSEDFGKSGSGRLPVCVQEDQDLFDDRGPLTTAHLVEPKKSIPAGGVRIFGADINPFPGRNQIKEEGVERLPSKSNQQDRWESDDDSDIFSKAQKTSVKVSSSKDVPPLGVSKKKNVDLFDDDESEDDLFSNNVKSVKPTRDIKSNSMKNVKNPVSMPENSQLTPAMRKSTPFSDVNNQADVEDDLFSGKGLFSNTKSGLSHNLFSDDLFSSDSSGIFSNTSSTIQKPTSEGSSLSTKAASDSFSSSDSSNNLFSSSESSVKSNTIKSQKVFEKDLFSDEGDLFGNLNSGDDLFGTFPAPKKNENPSKVKEQSTISAISKSLSKNIFGDDETDDLFSYNISSSSSVEKKVVENDSLFSDKQSNNLISAIGSTKAVKQAPDNDEDDLFTSNKQSDGKNFVQNSKSSQSGLKSRKNLNKQSLFESDSDDDLFSSPQGSLSSRKSLQPLTANVESKNERDKKQGSSLLNKEQSSSKVSKTDFSSIFSNNISEGSNYLTSHKVSAVSKSNDFFEDNKDILFNSVVDVKTPDLFTNSSAETASKDDPLTGPQEFHREVINDEITSKYEAVNSALIKTSLEPEQIAENEIIPNKTDIFDDSYSHERVQGSHKPEPPKSLNIIPTISESLSNNTASSVEKSQKPPLLKKPTPKVPFDELEPKDIPDGDVLTPPSPTKALPGKLKASQLIKINTAALLPGAKRQVNREQSDVEADLATDIHNNDSSSVVTDSASVVTNSLSASIHPALKQEEDVLPKSSLLQSVNKERAKIQGRRRPSSRRARQEAIRASSIEVDGENTVFAPTASSNLMSPSTDEEDLFSVPDVKTVSPTSDIFGTPTVLSPVIRQELPSSFVSAPFLHSQPPPLDEEDEEMPNQDDIFVSQNALGIVNKEKNEVSIDSEVQTKQEKAEDLFGDVDDDSLFSDMREAPPPLEDDDDNDDDDDELFMSNNQRKSSYNSFNHSLFTTSDKSDKVSNKNDLLANIVPSLNDKGVFKKTNNFIDSDDSLFLPKGNAKAIGSDSLSSQTVQQGRTEDYPFDSAIGIASKGDPLFPTTLSDQVPTNLKNSGYISAKIKNVSSQDIKPNEDENNDSLFTNSVKSAKGPEASSLFIDSNEEESEDALFSSQPKLKKDNNSTDLFRSIENTSADATDESLFTSPKSSNNGTYFEQEKTKSTKPKIRDEKPLKKDMLFDEEEEESSGNLFGSGVNKKVKTITPMKTSLFGDEDDDDIFGSLTLSKSISSSKPTPTLNTPSNLGNAQKGTKPGTSKPVKLEAKQAFSDPLFSNK